MTEGLWSCGTLGKVHGLRGELYLNLSAHGLEHLAGGTEFFLVCPQGRTPEGAERVVPCVVTRAGGTAQRPLVRLDLATTRDEAVALQGCELLAAGGALAELPHFRVGDLLGLRVSTQAGHLLGEVEDVFETPAHEVLQVRTPAGGELLLPLVEELVRVDREAGIAVVVDGLVDEPGGGP